MPVLLPPPELVFPPETERQVFPEPRPRNLSAVVFRYVNTPSTASLSHNGFSNYVETFTGIIDKLSNVINLKITKTMSVKGRLNIEYLVIKPTWKDSAGAKIDYITFNTIVVEVKKNNVSIYTYKWSNQAIPDSSFCFFTALLDLSVDVNENDVIEISFYTDSPGVSMSYSDAIAELSYSLVSDNAYALLTVSEAGIRLEPKAFHNKAFFDRVAEFLKDISYTDPEAGYIDAFVINTGDDPFHILDVEALAKADCSSLSVLIDGKPYYMYGGFRSGYSFCPNAPYFSGVITQPVTRLYRCWLRATVSKNHTIALPKDTLRVGVTDYVASGGYKLRVKKQLLHIYALSSNSYPDCPRAENVCWTLWNNSFYTSASGRTLNYTYILPLTDSDYQIKLWGYGITEDVMLLVVSEQPIDKNLLRRLARLIP